MTSGSEGAAQRPHAEDGYEQRDVRFRPLIIAGAIFVGSWALAFLLVWLLFGYLSNRQTRLSPPANVLEQMYGREAPPAPRLQTNPREDLTQMNAEQDATLNSYGWVDQKAGIAHIPIERAMELVAERGLPVRTEPEAAPAAAPPAEPSAPAPQPGGQP